jgi:rhamnose transport system permease protein
MTAAFTGWPRYVILGVPVMAWMGVAAFAIMVVVMNRTTLGRSFYAVGGNPHAAIYTGLNVGRTQFYAFVLSGMLAGLCGYLWVARYAVAYVDIAGGFELDVVAACVIGGLSIAGGAGTVLGTVLGALFLGVVKNALPVVNISPFWQLAISGAAIIIAVVFNARAGKSRQGRVILKSAERTQ